MLNKIKNILLEYHKSKNGKKKTIQRSDLKDYLTRYYLFRKPVWWMPSIYLHCFHSSDQDLELHSHPWGFSVSLILSGSYKEEYFDGDEIKTRIMKPGMLNFISADKYHRVDLIDDEVWTLFISGRKMKNWGFIDRNTKKYIPAEEFENYKNSK